MYEGAASAMQWRCPKFSISGEVSQGVWETSISKRGPEAKSSKSWSNLKTWVRVFHCRNDQNVKMSPNLPPDSWPVCFTVGGLSAPFGGLRPLALAWRHHVRSCHVPIYADVFHFLNVCSASGRLCARAFSVISWKLHIWFCDSLSDLPLCIQSLPSSYHLRQYRSSVR